MISQWGWTAGKGLGAQEQGEVTPVSNSMCKAKAHGDMTGLGYGDKRRRMAAPPWRRKDMSAWVSGDMLNDAPAITQQSIAPQKVHVHLSPSVTGHTVRANTRATQGVTKEKPKVAEVKANESTDTCPKEDWQAIWHAFSI